MRPWGPSRGRSSSQDRRSEFDPNRDGRIDASDTALASLRVWKDANSNGIVDAGELLTLQQAGVGSLSPSYTTGTAVDTRGKSHRQLGSTTTTQGATRQMTDVWFSVGTMRCGVRRRAGARARLWGLDGSTAADHGDVRIA